MRFYMTSILLVAAVAFAADDPRGQLDAFADGLDRLTGRFEQITIDEDGAIAEESTGRFYFQAPDRFRWDYETPFAQELVADGERLWHFDESLDQVTVREQPEPEQSPLLVLTRPHMLERFYRVEPSDAENVIEFVPRDEEVEFERARLHFRRGVPEMLEMRDRFGQVTRLHLADLERNPRFADDLFNFVPPEGVDVLEGY